MDINSNDTAVLVTDPQNDFPALQDVVECHPVTAGKSQPPAIGQSAGGKRIDLQCEVLKELLQQHNPSLPGLAWLASARPTARP